MKTVGIYTVLIFAALILWCSVSQAQSTFYQGKTIKTVVGYLPGDGFDVWARIVSAHLGKHIAGNPEFIVQNMAGASSRIAANYIYRVAKPDGLTIGAIGGSLYLDQLQGRKEVQFDWSKFSWLGSTDRIEWLFYMEERHSIQIRGGHSQSQRTSEVLKDRNRAINTDRSVSSRKIGFLSFPRQVTW